MGFIEVEYGGKVYVEDLNPQGKPVLFLHGWPVNHKNFEYQYSLLAQHGYRCIGVDLRGFGQSDRPWTGYSYDRLADDIRVIIDQLQLHDVTLVGHSMGGAITIRYMARHCGYGVSKIALLAAAAPIFTQRPNYPYGMTVEAVNKLIDKTNRDRPEMVKEFGDIFFASNVSPIFRDWFNSLGIEASSHATAMTAMSLRDEDLREDLGKICVPTAIFHGKLDKVCPFEFGVLQHQGIPCSTLIPFENSGHAVFYDELEKFNSLFLAFLDQA